MGHIPYVRKREEEFNLKNVSRAELLAKIKETQTVVQVTLEQLDEAQLQADHIEEVLGYTMTNRFFLIHLAAHLSYHLGQINYLRRILE